MSSEASDHTSIPDLFELKSSSLTVPVLRLFDSDMERVAGGLADRAAQARGFFHNAPIVIDLSTINSARTGVDLAVLVGLIRGLGMLPIGVQGGSAEQNQAAELLELAILGNRPVSGRKPAPKPAQQPTVGSPLKSTLITRPVRSGQRVYARGGDLIVTAAVSSGAEVFADGNIHVYDALRGRALAGIKGDKSARIFCRALGAELVAIAGCYKVSEKFAPEHLGQSVQIYMSQGRLVVEPV
jgi:septum site-determining protein MinC